MILILQKDSYTGSWFPTGHFSVGIYGATTDYSVIGMRGLDSGRAGIRSVTCQNDIPSTKSITL